MPHSATNTIPPVPFPEGSHESISASIEDIIEEFRSDVSICREWSEWANRYAPRSDDAVAHLVFMGQSTPPIPYRIPLKSLLLDRNVKIEAPEWLYQPLEQLPINRPLIQWPTQLAAAMHSVRSEMNRHPYPTRLYSPTDEELIAARTLFSTHVITVYSDVGGYRSTAWTKQRLTSLLWRKVSFAGEISNTSGESICFFCASCHLVVVLHYFSFLLSITGGKAELANNLKQKDLDFVTVLNRRLSGQDIYYLRQSMGPEILPSASADAIVLEKIKQTPLTLNALRQFRAGCPILDNAMTVVMSLFQDRNDAICEAHAEVNSEKNHYEKYLRSFYLPFSFMQALAENPLRTDIKERFFGSANWSGNDTKNLLILAKKANTQKWIILSAELATCKIALIDPERNNSQPFTASELSTCTAIEAIVKPFLSSLRDGDWKCRPSYHKVFTDPIANDFDSGMYVMAIIYFLSTETPVFFSQQTVDSLRLSFPYWLLCKALPY
jgi:hypothetical protein